MEAPSSALPELSMASSFEELAPAESPPQGDEEEMPRRTDTGHIHYRGSEGRQVDQRDPSQEFTGFTVDGTAEIVRFLKHTRNQTVWITVWSDGYATHSGVCVPARNCKWGHDIPTIHRVTLKWGGNTNDYSLASARLEDFGSVKETWPDRNWDAPGLGQSPQDDFTIGSPSPGTHWQDCSSTDHDHALGLLESEESCKLTSSRAAIQKEFSNFKW